MTKIFGIIYKAVNKINGKVYIGQTTQRLSKRKGAHVYEARHKNNTNCAFHNALRKYGKKNFSWEIVECCKSRKELDEREFYYIEYYNSFKNGYNLTKGGGGMSGWNHTKETCQKISIAMLGKKLGPFTKEHRKKMSMAQMGIKNHMYGKKGKDSPFYGKKRSEETIKKIVNKLRNRTIPEDIKTKISNSVSSYWLIIYPNGKSLIIKNLRKFCKQNKLDYSCMNSVSMGRQKRHKNYSCKKLYEDIIKVIT